MGFQSAGGKDRVAEKAAGAGDTGGACREREKARGRLKTRLLHGRFAVEVAH